MSRRRDYCEAALRNAAATMASPYHSSSDTRLRGNGPVSIVLSSTVMNLKGIVALRLRTRARVAHICLIASRDGFLPVAMWSIIAGGFALAIAAFGGALGQGKAIASAAEGIARNPSAAGEIRGVLILGLILIESLSIYVFVISLILFFLKPFSA